MRIFVPRTCRTGQRFRRERSGMRRRVQSLRTSSKAVGAADSSHADEECIVSEGHVAEYRPEARPRVDHRPRRRVHRDVGLLIHAHRRAPSD